MPIRPENRHRYPKDWPQIRARILERARHQCERCDVPNYAFATPRGRGPQRDWTTRRAVADTWRGAGLKVTKIVLTIAHLNHIPEDCRDENLQALCQRCHLAYDLKHHQTNAYGTRRAGRAARDLFEESKQ